MLHDGGQFSRGRWSAVQNRMESLVTDTHMQAPDVFCYE
jgi:hypothetical protein